MRQSAQRTGQIWRQRLAVFGLCWLWLTACACWPIAHGYVSDAALLRITHVLTVVSAPTLRIEDFRLLYPHLALLPLLPLSGLPVFWLGLAPYLVSGAFGAVLLTWWNSQLRDKHYSGTDRALLLALVATHPMFVWGVTSGVQGGLSLLLFYTLYLGTVRVIREADARAFIMLGAIFGVYFFVDERTLFLYLAFLPLLPMIAPRKMLQASPSSLYLIVSMPLLLSLLAWVVYLAFVLNEGPLSYINQPGVSFRGAWHFLADMAWLRSYGGQFFLPLGVTFLLMLLAYPAVLWLIWRARRHATLMRDVEAMPIHLAVATAMATVTYFLAQPADMLYLLSAGLMAALVLMPRETGRRHRIQLFAVLLLSALGAGLALQWKPTTDAVRWQQAWRGQLLPEYFSGDEALGRWLNAHRQPTMLDEHAAFRAVVARGDAHGLLLTSMKEFKRAMQGDELHVAQVVVRDPDHNQHDRTGYGDQLFSERLPDSITWHFGKLYRDGMNGYQLVYDDAHWRVYRRIGMEAQQLETVPEMEYSLALPMGATP